MRFLLKESTFESDIHLNADLRDNFLKGGGEDGLDLAAMLIQLGRDNGIPAYSVWRAQCGLRRPQSFADLAQVGFVDRAVSHILAVN